MAKHMFWYVEDALLKAMPKVLSWQRCLSRFDFTSGGSYAMVKGELQFFRTVKSLFHSHI